MAVTVTMSMEEYKLLEEKSEKLTRIKRLARDLIAEKSEDNSGWAKVSDVKTALTLEETKQLLRQILEDC